MAALERRDPMQFEPPKWRDWGRITLSSVLSAMFTAAVTIYALGQQNQATRDRIDNIDHYGSANFQVYKEADQARWETVHLDLVTLHEDMTALRAGQRQLGATSNP